MYLPLVTAFSILAADVAGPQLARRYDMKNLIPSRSHSSLAGADPLNFTLIG